MSGDDCRNKCVFVVFGFRRNTVSNEADVMSSGSGRLFNSFAPAEANDYKRTDQDDVSIADQLRNLCRACADG